MSENLPEKHHGNQMEITVDPNEGLFELPDKLMRPNALAMLDDYFPRSKNPLVRVFKPEQRIISKSIVKARKTYFDKQLQLLETVLEERNKLIVAEIRTKLTIEFEKMQTALVQFMSYADRIQASIKSDVVKRILSDLLIDITCVEDLRKRFADVSGTSEICNLAGQTIKDIGEKAMKRVANRQVKIDNYGINVTES